MVDLFMVLLYEVRLAKFNTTYSEQRKRQYFKQSSTVEPKYS